jgi:hypothetical protein
MIGKVTNLHRSNKLRLLKNHCHHYRPLSLSILQHQTTKPCVTKNYHHYSTNNNNSSNNNYYMKKYDNREDYYGIPSAYKYKNYNHNKNDNNNDNKGSTKVETTNTTTMVNSTNHRNNNHNNNEYNNVNYDGTSTHTTSSRNNDRKTLRKRSRNVNNRSRTNPTTRTPRTPRTTTTASSTMVQSKKMKSRSPSPQSTSSNNFIKHPNTNTNTKSLSRKHQQNIQHKVAATKKIQSLLHLDNQLREYIQQYEDNLGNNITSSFTLDTTTLFHHHHHHHPINGVQDNDNTKVSNYKSIIEKEKKKDWLRRNNNDIQDIAYKLIETEEEYINIAFLLRDLVLKWSRLNVKSRHFVARCLASSTDNYDHNYNPNLSSIPTENALNYLILLESLRKQRGDLYTEAMRIIEEDKKQKEDEDENGNVTNRMIQWFRDKVFSFGNRNDYENTLIKLQQLDAHTNPKYTAKISDYSVLMKGFVYGKRLHLDTSCSFSSSSNNNDNDTRKNHEITFQYLDSILRLMERSVKYGNPNCIPDRPIYHMVMQQCQLSPTMKNALRCLELFESMDKLSNRHSRNIVLVAFRDLAQSSNNKDEILEAISIVERIVSNINLDEEGNVIDSEPGDGDKNGVDSSFETYDEDMADIYPPCTFSYTIALQLIGDIGHNLAPDYLERIDRLMVKIIGQENYKILCADNNEDIVRVHPKMLAELVRSFSTSSDRAYLEKAKIILKKMDRMRKKSLTQDDKLIVWDDQIPDSRTYNTYILGLVHHAMVKSKNESFGDYQRRIRKDAIYATNLLGTMMEDGSSMPSPITYYRILRLWSQCKSKDAGEKGEEILSAMNVHKSSYSDKAEFDEFFFRHYQTAIECWQIASSAHCAGVPRSVLQLLDRMGAQYDIDQYNYITEERNADNDKVFNDQAYVYVAALKCCADTVVEADKADALKVSFDIYKRMEEEKTPLSPYIFVLLMKCCKFAETEENRLSLSKQVFDNACAKGHVSRHFLQTLKQVNFNLFQSYKADIKHSENNKDQVIAG